MGGRARLGSMSGNGRTVKDSEQEMSHADVCCLRELGQCLSSGCWTFDWGLKEQTYFSQFWKLGSSRSR